MFRKLLCAIFVMSLSMSFVAAEEFFARITKVDGDKVTFTKFAKGAKKGEKGDEMTLPVAGDAKITKGKFNKEDKKFEAGDAVEKGLKNEMFTKIDDKKGGPFAQITTSDDNKTITAMSVKQFDFGKFGKDKKKAEDKKADEKKTDEKK